MKLPVQMQKLRRTLPIRARSFTCHSSRRLTESAGGHQLKLVSVPRLLLVQHHLLLVVDTPAKVHWCAYTNYMYLCARVSSASVCIYVRLCVYTPHTYTSTRACEDTRMLFLNLVCVCACVYVRTRTCTHTLTHTRTDENIKQANERVLSGSSFAPDASKSLQIEVVTRTKVWDLGFRINTSRTQSQFTIGPSPYLSHTHSLTHSLSLRLSLSLIVPLRRK